MKMKNSQQNPNEDNNSFISDSAKLVVKIPVKLHVASCICEKCLFKKLRKSFVQYDKVLYLVHKTFHQKVLKSVYAHSKKTPRLS